MIVTLPQVVKQFQQDWTAQLEPQAILKVCHELGYQWRERSLDPVTTLNLFFVQVTNGNTACSQLRGDPLEEPSWLGRRCFWVDGSSFSMSDTPELQEHVGQPGGQ